MEDESLYKETGKNRIRKSIEIPASDDKVWDVLTISENVKKWANAFEEGCYVESDWLEGAAIAWKTRDGVNLLKGKIEVIYPSKLLKLRYFDDENAAGDPEPGAYEEHYLLSEHNGSTTLTIDSGPLEDKYIKSLGPQWDEALKIIKKLAGEK